MSRNFGIFSPAQIQVSDLTAFCLTLGGFRLGDSTLQIGDLPDQATIELSTKLSDGCFDDEEHRLLAQQLAFTPVSYVGIHMGKTDRAFDKALSVARAIQDRWGGKIDYSGAGGNVEDPFNPDFVHN